MRLRSISTILHEVFDRAPHWLAHRKSWWNLLLIPLGLGGVGVITSGLFHFMWWVHLLFYPVHAGHQGEFWNSGISLSAFVPSLLFVVPPFFASMPLAALMSNGILWLVPTIREVFEKEAKALPRTSFGGTMENVLNTTVVLVPICMLLSFLGAVSLSSLK